MNFQSQTKSVARKVLATYFATYFQSQTKSVARKVLATLATY